MAHGLVIVRLPHLLVASVFVRHEFGPRLYALAHEGGDCSCSARLYLLRSNVPTTLNHSHNARLVVNRALPALVIGSADKGFIGLDNPLELFGSIGLHGLADT